MLIRQALIVPNSFQSLHSSQKRARNGRDGFIEMTLTDSHLLSFLGQLAPDAESGRHEPSRRSCAPPFIRTLIPCSALRRRAGAIRTPRRNANSCFPPYPAHGPQDAIGKEGDSLNAPPKATKLHYVKTPRKNAKSQLSLAVALKTSIERHMVAKKSDVGPWMVPFRVSTWGENQRLGESSTPRPYPHHPNSRASACNRP